MLPTFNLRTELLTFQPQDRAAHFEAVRSYIKKCVNGIQQSPERDPPVVQLVNPCQNKKGVGETAQLLRTPIAFAEDL